jgi:hypothetical protein
MTRSTKHAAAVLAGAVSLASAGYALGSQSGDGSAAAKARASTTPAANVVHRMGSRGDLGIADLAARLGVGAAQLRTALDDVRDELPRPERRDLFAGLAEELGIAQEKVEAALRANRPGRGERTGRDRLHTAIADALARELGQDAAKVRAAFEKVHPIGSRPPERRERRRLGDVEAALAKELGVTTARLREAFGQIKPSGGPRRGPFGGDLTAPAKAMGVEERRLEAAFAELHEQHEAEHERRRAAFAKALAGKLGISAEKVAEELGAGPSPIGHGGPGGRGFGGPGPR